MISFPGLLCQEVLLLGMLTSVNISIYLQTFVWTHLDNPCKVVINVRRGTVT